MQIDFSLFEEAVRISLLFILNKRIYIFHKFLRLNEEYYAALPPSKKSLISVNNGCQHIESWTLPSTERWSITITQTAHENRKHCQVRFVPLVASENKHLLDMSSSTPHGNVDNRIWKAGRHSRHRTQMTQRPQSIQQSFPVNSSQLTLSEWSTAIEPRSKEQKFSGASDQCIDLTVHIFYICASNFCLAHHER